MKHTFLTTQMYITPVVEIIETGVESGFAATDASGTGLGSLPGLPTSEIPW